MSERGGDEAALCVAVLGRKGGSAKSTTAYNLAGTLIAAGMRCLLVDLDSQASLTRALSDASVGAGDGVGARIAEPGRGFADVIRPVAPLLDLAPGDRSIEAAANALAQNPTGPLRLRLLLDSVRGQYGAVIVDTAPLLGFTQTAALLAADVAVVPTRTGAQQDIDALLDIFALRDELAAFRFAVARIAAILPSNYHGDEAPQRDGLAALRAAYGDLVAEPIPHSSLVERAINARVPVALGNPKSPVAAAFRALAGRIGATAVASPTVAVSGDTDCGGSGMTGSRRAGGPRLGPRVAQPQGAPPPLAPYLGTDRAATGVREVDVMQIAPDPDQPRRFFDPVRLAELAASIREHGLLQPLVVREVGFTATGDMGYIVVAGGRRLAAVRLLVDDPALHDAERERVRRVLVVLHRGAAAERRVLQLVENIQREALTAVEEARAFREIMRVDEIGTAALAERIGRSQGYVDERLRLLRHEAIEAAVEAGRLTVSAGAAVASLRDEAARAAWLARAAGGERIAASAVYASKNRPAPSHAAESASSVSSAATVYGSPAVALDAAPTAGADTAADADAATDATITDLDLDLDPLFARRRGRKGEGERDPVLETLRAMRADLARLAPLDDPKRRRRYMAALADVIEAAGDAVLRLSP